MNSKWLLVAMVMLGGTLGCASDESANVEPPTELQLDGKGDVSNGVTRMGDLPFGEAMDGEFTADFEMHAYSVSAKQASDLTVEITRSGSSSHLDTKLYLYAPTDRGYVRVATDDEAGWGQLSKIDIELRKEGNFLAVLGTDDGEGRGKYRISLTCHSGDCAREVVPDLVDSECPERISEMVEQCVVEESDVMWDMTGDPDLDLRATVELCTDENFGLGYHESMCELGGHVWCSEDFDTFFMDEMMVDCEDVAINDLVIDDPVGLETELVRALFDPVPDHVDVCDELDAPCNMHISVKSYEGRPSLRALAEAARVYTSRPWLITFDGDVADVEESLESFGDGLDGTLEPLFETITDAIGSTEVEAATLSGFFDRSGAEVDSTVHVLHFPTEKRVVIVEQTTSVF